MASNGALVIETGERTGRSPNDRFIADTPDVHDKIAWGAVNRPLPLESYEAIKAGIVDYLNEREVFVTRGRSPAKSISPVSRTFACSPLPATSAIPPLRASTPAPPWSSTSRNA